MARASIKVSTRLKKRNNFQNISFYVCRGRERKGGKGGGGGGREREREREGRGGRWGWVGVEWFEREVEGKVLNDIQPRVQTAEPMRSRQDTKKVDRRRKVFSNSLNPSSLLEEGTRQQLAPN